MAKVVATVQLFTDEGKPASGHTLKLEAFNLERNAWLAVASGKTDAKGNIQMTAGVVSGALAPSLRLVEAGNPAPRVLAHGGLMSYVPRSQLLYLDFGKVERLEETAHALQHTQTRFAQNGETVAGAAAVPAQTSRLTLNRVAIANPQLFTGVNLAAEVDPKITATPLIQAELLKNKELQVLKARELELNADLMDKTRENTLYVEQIATADKRIALLERDLASIQVERQTLNRELELIKARTKQPAEIEGMLLGLGSKLDASRKQMQKQQLPYRIGNIKVDLHGALTADGKSLVFGEGGVISTELINEETAGEEVKVPVPAIQGLTESAARRVLRSVGLRMSVAHQQLKPGQGVPGQAIGQHPAAGGALPHGSEVMVVFGEGSGDSV
ncbi:PASTA domain-containing protein [Marinobacterium lutimaris]|uniref:PASTA domain-containing protein n=1 Tax=Marinobacterium lutimaris TaxID=568106 RepID=A0A1H5XGR8_9GAMM|nr:PASTA domain-containing protein [Marinobacterium lutimaris]SEG10942.1 PASTA domain-containing protein [Marinobacterium lutimaris]